MTLRVFWQLVWLITVALFFSVPGSVFARGSTVGVLISREIAPYVAMIEGVETRLIDCSVQRFFLDAKGQPYSLGRYGDTLEPAHFDVMVAVGPEALNYLLPIADPDTLIYGMVLNPEKILYGSGPQPCGVMLNLPFKAQLTSIQEYLPELKQLGILYDPANNQSWYEDAELTAATSGIQLVPLQVRKTATGLKIIGEMSHADALLFIPDRTIISKVVIQYVIKEAFHRRIPTVGFNRFFHDSGAALSFIVDYKKVGEQVAEQVRYRLNGESCLDEQPPFFHSQVNEDTWRVLGLESLTGSGEGD